MILPLLLWVDFGLNRLSEPSLEVTPYCWQVWCPCWWRVSQHHRGTAETLFAHEAQLVMYCPQVVDDGSFILSILPAPGTVGVTSKPPESIGVMYPFKAHDFWGFLGGHHP